MMPVMDGYEAIRAIRKNNNLKNIPIIALTSKAQAEDRQLCIDAGANEYMSKPIDHEQLLSLLKIWSTYQRPYDEG
jgi:CheY-like chemotaxis protein